jgi:hypothetical protein
MKRESTLTDAIANLVSDIAGQMESVQRMNKAFTDLNRPLLESVQVMGKAFANLNRPLLAPMENMEKMTLLVNGLVGLKPEVRGPALMAIQEAQKSSKRRKGGGREITQADISREVKRLAGHIGNKAFGGLTAKIIAEILNGAFAGERIVTTAMVSKNSAFLDMRVKCAAPRPRNPGGKRLTVDQVNQALESLWLDDQESLVRATAEVIAKRIGHRIGSTPSVPTVRKTKTYQEILRAREQAKKTKRK